MDKLIFDRCCCGSSAKTPVVYDCCSKNLTGIFARSNILLTDTLMNGALVPITPDSIYSRQNSMVVSYFVITRHILSLITYIWVDTDEWKLAILQIQLGHYCICFVSTHEAF